LYKEIDVNTTGATEGSVLEVHDHDDTRRVPAVERVLDHILTEMDAGQLRPGARVNAARIAAKLNLSVAPVREALCMLAGRGVLELLPDRGAVMRPLMPTDVIQMWEVVAPVVALGFELAAGKIAGGADPSELQARYELIAREPLAIPPLAFLLKLNDYHWAANGMTDNKYLNIWLERLGISYWDRYLAELVDVHANIDGYLNNYRRIHEAIISGDGRAANAVMHYHARWSINLIRQSTVRVSAARRRQRAANRADPQ